MTLPELVESMYCKPCRAMRDGDCFWEDCEDGHCDEFRGIVKICKAAQLAILEEMPGEPLKAGVWLKSKTQELGEG